jgi:hypothetical protein
MDINGNFMENNNFYKYLSVEDIEHAKVILYLNEHFSDIIFFHINSESKKTPFERYKYSLFGKMKGLPDIAILYPKYTTKIEDGKSKKMLMYHGLFIELKAPEHNVVIKKGKNEGKIRKAIGVLSDEQRIIIEKLNKIKYLAVCCFGSEEAITVIKNYMAN